MGARILITERTVWKLKEAAIKKFVDARLPPSPHLCLIAALSDYLTSQGIEVPFDVKYED